MSIFSRIGWAVIALSFVLSPFLVMQQTYGGEITGIMISTPQITKVQDDYNPIYVNSEIPSQGISEEFCWTEINMSGCDQEENPNFARWTLYSIKNIDKHPLFIHLLGPCFANGNRSDFDLPPNETKNFFCVREMKRLYPVSYTYKVPTIITEYPNSCLYVSSESFRSDQGYKKLCESNDWK